jgi:hypothetical protein
VTDNFSPHQPPVSGIPSHAVVYGWMWHRQAADMPWHGVCPHPNPVHNPFSQHDAGMGYSFFKPKCFLAIPASTPILTQKEVMPRLSENHPETVTFQITPFKKEYFKRNAHETQ